MPATDKKIVSIVLPVYNEATTIASVIDAIDKALSDTGIDSRLVLIDDGSTDESWTQIQRIAADRTDLTAIRFSRNFGKEYAVAAGLEAARGDAVIVMDADGQHPPELLPKLVKAWRETNADVVEAVKSDRGQESGLDRMSARGFYALWSRLSGFPLEAASDFKLLDRRAVDAFLSMDERNVFFRGMTAWIGFRRIQVPFEVAKRSGGESGWTLFRRLRLALMALTGFSAAPLHVVTIAGVVFLLFAFLLAIQTLYVYLRGQAVTGFATVILLLLIIGSLLMFSLGVIGEYLARIYDEVKRRPRYVISERIDAATTADKHDSAT